jgi:hypothetical protein
VNEGLRLLHFAHCSFFLSPTGGRTGIIISFANIIPQTMKVRMWKTTIPFATSNIMSRMGRLTYMVAAIRVAVRGTNCKMRTSRNFCEGSRNCIPLLNCNATTVCGLSLCIFLFRPSQLLDSSYMSNLTSSVDKTPSQSSRMHSRVHMRSLREVISSCDKGSISEHVSVTASIDSLVSVPGEGPSSSWVASIHDKSKTPNAGPGKYLSPYQSSSTPIHRQLNFSTPTARTKPSPTVTSVASDRWCIESHTPAMRFTPPNMSMRGMRMPMRHNREPIGAYKIDESVRRDKNERGASLCILPTPLLRFQSVPVSSYTDQENNGYLQPAAASTISPVILPSRPSPSISLWGSSPTPVGPAHKKHRAGYNSRHFPIPRASTGSKAARRQSAADILQSNNTRR